MARIDARINRLRLRFETLLAAEKTAAPKGADLLAAIRARLAGVVFK
jgi:hypothetical protein